MQLQRHLFRSRTQASRTNPVRVCAAVKARWLVDVRYGRKLEAVALLQEWMTTIGSQAGLTSGSSSLLSGAVGVAESRLEMELEFESLAQLESFWAAIPPSEHRAWAERAKDVLIDGSPLWHLYRTVAVPWGQPSEAQGQATATQAQASGGQPSLQQGVVAVEDPGQVDTVLGGGKIATDWKGDPIVIRPGDKGLGGLF